MTAVDTLTLGDTPLARIGLGTNRLRNTPENVAFVRDAVAAGIGLIDTAHVYAGGESEQTIGAALSSSPDGCVVATKGGYGKRPPRGAERARSPRAFVGCGPTVSTSTTSTSRIRRRRWRRASGPSMSTGSAGRFGTSASRTSRWTRSSGPREVAPIAAVQNHYNLSERAHDDVVDYCADNDIVFVPYFPLRADGGRAAAEIAKRRRDARPDRTRVAPAAVPGDAADSRHPVARAPEGEPRRRRDRADRRGVRGPRNSRASCSAAGPEDRHAPAKGLALLPNGDPGEGQPGFSSGPASQPQRKRPARSFGRLGRRWGNPRRRARSSWVDLLDVCTSPPRERGCAPGEQGPEGGRTSRVVGPGPPPLRRPWVSGMKRRAGPDAPVPKNRGRGKGNGLCHAASLR